jgi:hypothetical protein
MLAYCDAFLARLWDQTESEKLLLNAVGIVSRAAQDDFKRDNIRTEPFTKKVKMAVGTRTRLHLTLHKGKNRGPHRGAQPILNTFRQLADGCER